MLTAIVPKEKDGSSNSKSSESVASLESIKDIVSDSSETIFNETAQLLESFVSMPGTGDLELSDQFMKELYELNSKVDAVNAVSSTIQNRWSEIDSSIAAIKSSIDEIKNDVANNKTEIAGLKQYFKIDNLLCHNFPLPSEKLTSLQFSVYIAEQINRMLPFLPVPVTSQHISTAHPLATKAKKSSVIVVRFCNRHIKDMIYDHRHFISKGMLITEHLTDENKAITKEAKDLFGAEFVTSENCKPVVLLDGKSIQVKSIECARKLFVSYCESIGYNDNYTFKKPAFVTRKVFNHSKSSSNTVTYSSPINSRQDYFPTRQDVPYSKSTFYNSNSNRRPQQSWYQNKPKGRKPRKPYSVRNRNYYY